MRCATPRSGTTVPGWNGAAFRQAAETRGDPAAVALREILGVGDRAPAAAWSGSLRGAWMNTHVVAPRAAMPAQPNE